MRIRVALSALGLGLLLVGVATGRYLLARSTSTDPPSRFLASFNGLDTVEKHLRGVERAQIAQLVGGEVRVDQGVTTRSYHGLCSYPKSGGLADIRLAMEAIGDDIVAQVAAVGGSMTCKSLGWGVQPGEWAYHVGGRRGVVTILVIQLNEPAPTDLPANLAVLVHVAEF
jgi:hypothetical protein